MAYVVLEKDATSALVTSGITYAEMAVEVVELCNRFEKATGTRINANHIKVEAYEGAVCLVYRGMEDD